MMQKKKASFNYLQNRNNTKKWNWQSWFKNWSKTLVSFLKGIRNEFLIQIYVSNMSSQVKPSRVWKMNTNCFFRSNIRQKNNIIKPYKNLFYCKAPGGSPKHRPSNQQAYWMTTETIRPLDSCTHSAGAYTNKTVMVTFGMMKNVSSLSFKSTFKLLQS